MLSACTLSLRWAADGSVGHGWEQFLQYAAEAGDRGLEMLERLQSEGREMMCSPWSAATIKADKPKGTTVTGGPKNGPTLEPVVKEAESKGGPTLGPPLEEIEKPEKPTQGHFEVIEEPKQKPPLERFEGKPSPPR